MDKIFDFIDKSSAVYVKELQALLRQPSITAHNDGIEEAAATVKNLLQQISRHVEAIQLNQSKAPLLYAEISGETKRTVLFYSYYDVRPPGSLNEWSHQPFSATIDGGKIYARGAADNKGDLVARIKAVEAFIKIRKKPPLSVKFVVEGESGIGSPTLISTADLCPEMFRADACIWATGSRDDEGRLEVTFTDNRRPENCDSPSEIVNTVCEAVTEFYRRKPVVLSASAKTSPIIQIVSDGGTPAVGLSIANRDSRAGGSNENINTADFVDGIKLAAIIMQKLSGIQEI
ncbi:MAG: M20/M25/M40 family metallo-hydrolase [Firmicutes bacterium]|nr:M20/M25/M40 family metallo-hydrolase [Bacillota bacterium]HXL04666.1 M20/M25/M40 family metallo-hydrolase [Bacillota bacterium]